LTTLGGFDDVGAPRLVVVDEAPDAVLVLVDCMSLKTAVNSDAAELSRYRASF